MRELPEGFRIDVFSEQEAIEPEDVIGLWAAEGKLSEEQARERIAEILLVSVAPDGALAGVATAYIGRDPVLNLNLWHYRTLVAPAHRQSNLAASMAVAARDHLERLYVSGADTRAAGILSEVHSPALKQLGRAVWRQTGFTFLGEDAQGSHIRVHYFPGAQAPAPPTR